jgi:hypothetical protein
MRIDRAEFLRLTVVLGAAACEPRAAEIVVVPTQPVPSAAPSSAPARPSAPRAAVDPNVDPSCSNAVGSSAACERVGPACEGLHDECLSLGDDLRPRVMERFADCFAKAKAPRCRDRALGACMRAAVESACVEPGTTKACEDLLAACRAAGKKPDYTLEQCTKVLSAVKPEGAGRWDEVDRQRLGPSSEGDCSLRYVLPYQPWGPSWR